MAGVRVTLLRLLHNSANPFSKMQSFRSYNYSDMRISSSLQAFVKESQSPETLTNTHFKTLASQSLLYTQCYKAKPITAFSPTVSNLHLLHNSPLILISPFSNYRSYSWSSGGKADKSGVPTASGASGVDGSDNDVFGSDFVDKVKDAWHTAVDAGTYTAQKAKEASDELIPYTHQLLDSHPYLKDVIIPFGGTFAGTILAWSVMPRLFRRFHKYATQSPAASPSGSVSWEQVPYERTIWGALEDPVRYLITFMAFSQMLVVPGSRYVF